MRRLRIVSYVLLALVGVGCTFTSSTTPEEADKLVIKVSSSDGAEWCEGDEIAVIECGAAYRTSQCIHVEEGGDATFTLEEPNAECEEFGYGAIFPADAVIEDDSIDLSRVRLVLPLEQSPDGAMFDVSADLRVAPYVTYEAMPQPLKLEFRRVTAMGALTIENLPEGSVINSVKLSAEGATPFAGELIVDLRSGAVTYDKMSSELRLSYKQGVSSEQMLYFITSPSVLKAGSLLKVDIECGEQHYEHTLTLDADVEFSVTELPELVVTLEKAPEPDVCTFRRVDKITSGKAYLIAAERCVAQPIEYSKYGYLKSVDGDTDDDGIIVFSDCANAFYIEAKDGGYTLRQVVDNRYLYQYKDYNSVNVDAAPTEGDVWSITKSGDAFKITNVSKGKYLQYDLSYSSFGSYSDSRGTLPQLYELEGEVILPEEGDDGGYDGGDDGNEDDGGGSVGDSTQTIKYGLELPAKPADGAYPNAKWVVVRYENEDNYTHYYDVDTYTSLWVAYPLAARHMGSIGRPDAWDWNPYISTSDQVNLCSRSYAGDYSRGHLIPNASRNGIRGMQLQTFYVTNSVPQVQEGFNGGIWQKLEAALQSIAESETIYIVTGVVFNKIGESRTISYTKAKDDTKSVPVPNYFYKVVLKIKCDEEGNVSDAMTVGFWFENKYYDNNTYSNYAVSVDQIEEWTGFDYFPAIGNLQADAESNKSWSEFKSF